MAGKITANTVQLGDSATATNNFVLKTNVDNTAVLARGNDGATTQNILAVASDGKVTLTQGETLTQSKIQSDTAKPSTSGTSVDFITSIPSWAKRITVMFNGVSLANTNISNIQIQIGSGSIDTATYSSACNGIFSGVVQATSTTGFIVSVGITDLSTHNGSVTLNNVSGNTWTSTGVLYATSLSYITPCAGIKTLSGTLDRLRITSVNGTATFDAGSINIFWE